MASRLLSAGQTRIAGRQVGSPRVVLVRLNPSLCSVAGTTVSQGDTAKQPPWLRTVVAPYGSSSAGKKDLYPNAFGLGLLFPSPPESTTGRWGPRVGEALKSSTFREAKSFYISRFFFDSLSQLWVRKDPTQITGRCGQVCARCGRRVVNAKRCPSPSMPCAHGVGVADMSTARPIWSSSFTTHSGRCYGLNPPL